MSSILSYSKNLSLREVIEIYNHQKIKINLLCILFLNFLYGCSQPSLQPYVSEVNSEGNAMNNLLNGGFVAHQGEWIFYINPDHRHYIYAKHINGDEDKPQLLIRHEANFLNVLGDRIFYQNRSDENKLYKASITGMDAEALTENAVNIVFVDSEWIYFLKDERLHRMRHDGTQLEKLTDIIVHSYVVMEDTIYFVEPFGKSFYYLNLKTKVTNELAALPHTAVEAKYTADGIVYRIDEDHAIYELTYRDPVPRKLIDEAEFLLYTDEQFVYYYDERLRKYNRKTGQDENWGHPDDKYYHVQFIPGRLFYLDHPNREHWKLMELQLDNTEHVK